MLPTEPKAGAAAEAVLRARPTPHSPLASRGGPGSRLSSGPACPETAPEPRRVKPRARLGRQRSAAAAPARESRRTQPTALKSLQGRLGGGAQWEGPEMFTTPAAAKPGGAAGSGAGGSGPWGPRGGWPTGMSPPQAWAGGGGRLPPARSPRRPRDTYGRPGGLCWGPRSPALHPAVLQAACGRAAPIFSALPSPEGARDHTASPPRPRHRLSGTPARRSPNPRPAPLGPAPRGPGPAPSLCANRKVHLARPPGDHTP